MYITYIYIYICLSKTTNGWQHWQLLRQLPKKRKASKVVRDFRKDCGKAPGLPQSEVSRPRAEQNRPLASCIGTEQSIELASSQSAEHHNSREPSPEANIGSRLSTDSIPEITRPSRQEVDSPRSINTGDRLEGVNYSERSQSSEARVSRLKTSKKESHRRHSDIRDT